MRIPGQGLNPLKDSRKMAVMYMNLRIRKVGGRGERVKGLNIMHAMAMSTHLIMQGPEVIGDVRFVMSPAPSQVTSAFQRNVSIS